MLIQGLCTNPFKSLQLCLHFVELKWVLYEIGSHTFPIFGTYLVGIKKMAKYLALLLLWLPHTASCFYLLYEKQR